MLPRKAFSWISVTRLVFGLLFCFLGASLVAGAIGPWTKQLSQPHQMIANLVLGSLAFHGAIIIGVAWILAKNGDTWSEVFGIGATPTGKAIGSGLLAGLVATPLAIGLQILTGFVLTLLHYDAVEQQVVENLRDANSIGARLCFAVVTLVLAPAAEEIFFRGVLYASLKRSLPEFSRIAIRAWVVPRDGGQKRRNLAAGLLAANRGERGRRNARRISMVAVSVLFAVIHGNLLAVVPLFALAMIFAWLYERTGNILAPIMAHGLFNTANFLFIVLNVDF